MTKVASQKTAQNRRASIPIKAKNTTEMKKIQRHCAKKKCVCKFNLTKIARKDLPWAQLVGSQDILLQPSNTHLVENEYLANSLVLMNLGDKFGKKILEAKKKAAASNLPNGVLKLGISPETIQSLVRFASEGRINLQNVTDQTREEIWQFSIKFSVPGLLKICGQFLLENLTASNAAESYKTAMRYLCMDYQTAVRKFILQNFIQVAQEDPKFTLLVEFFDDILPDDELNIREEQLFLILQKLAEENPHMVSQLAKLTRFVRYLLIQPKVFQEQIAGKSLASNATVQKNGMELASDYFKTGNAKATRKTPPKQLLCKTRIPYEIVFSFGGWVDEGTRKGPSKLNEAFDIRSNSWEDQKFKIPTRRAYHGVEAIDENVYLFGGYDGDKYYNSTEVISLKDGKWKPRCPMNKSRCYISTAVHQNKIYAIGGFDGLSRKKSVECYDPKENSWTLLPPMSNVRSDGTAVAYGNKIYVIGGFTGEEILNSVEVFDTETQEWTFGPSMTTRRSGVKAVVYRQKIFVLGGFDGDQRLKSVECLDMTQPRPSWSSGADMITTRSNFSVTVVEDKILVMGGFVGQEEGITNKVEAFSGDKGVWIPCPGMTHHKSALACVTVPGLKNARTYSSQR